MIPPGTLVLLTPLVAGTFFGVETLAQLQTLVVHGITPRTNRAQTLTRQLSHWVQRGTDAHKVAVIGDTVGDPLKDTSGPSLNILIKLMAVESLVYAPLFAHGGLFFKLL